jgi:glycosyltransferase involved in cell wall biosynthesis
MVGTVPTQSEALARKMRIALVVPGGVDRTGEYRVIPALVALLGRLSRAHDLQVIALAQEAEPGEWRLAGAHVHNIGARRTRLRALRAIIALHGGSRFDLVHAVWSGSCGLVAVAAARLLRIPSLVHVAGGELVALRAIGYGGALTWRGRIRERMTLRAASAVTAASAPVIASVTALGVAAERVPLGVDVTAWPPREPRRRDPRRSAKLIHVASLNRVKDQPTLLRALAALARAGVGFELEIVGDDTLAGEMQTLARELGLIDRINFRGFLPQRRLRPLVEAADLMIVSSRHEAGPLVALEAAVAGVPTVGTAVGHIAEWAPRAAVAVPVGDPAALAGAVAALLADEESRLRIARAAFQRAVLEDAEHTAQRFHAIYTKLAATSGKDPRSARAH